MNRRDLFRLGNQCVEFDRILTKFGETPPCYEQMNQIFEMFKSLIQIINKMRMATYEFPDRGFDGKVEGEVERKMHKCHTGPLSILQCEENPEGRLYLMNQHITLPVNFCPFCGFEGKNE